MMKGKKMSFPVTVANLAPGAVVDIRALEQMVVREHCEVVVYFEADLANNSTYEQDLKEYAQFQEHERPFILLPVFLEFQREMNPAFNQALNQIPLGVTIVRIEQTDNTQRVIGLLPFLDEMDMQ